jgi:hypothetical protein
MAPTQEIVQQPQAQETMTEPQANGVIAHQPVSLPTKSSSKTSYPFHRCDLYVTNNNGAPLETY